jgi:hypothetical protein
MLNVESSWGDLPTMMKPPNAVPQASDRKRAARSAMICVIYKQIVN